MATPIGHALAGSAAAMAAGADVWRSWRALAMVVALSVLPDVDLIPGLLMDDPGIYHVEWTHTLGATLLAGFVGGAIWSRGSPRFWRCAGIAAAVYGSHVLVDFFMTGPTTAEGVALLRPFVAVRFENPLPLPEGTDEFFRLHWGPGTEALVRGVLSWHTLAIIGVEVLVFAPLAALAWWGRRRKSGSRIQDSGSSETDATPDP